MKVQRSRERSKGRSTGWPHGPRTNTCENTTVHRAVHGTVHGAAPRSTGISWRWHPQLGCLQDGGRRKVFHVRKAMFQGFFDTWQTSDRFAFRLPTLQELNLLFCEMHEGRCHRKPVWVSRHRGCSAVRSRDASCGAMRMQPDPYSIHE